MIFDRAFSPGFGFVLGFLEFSVDDLSNVSSTVRPSPAVYRSNRKNASLRRRVDTPARGSMLADELTQGSGLFLLEFGIQFQ